VKHCYVNPIEFVFLLNKPQIGRIKLYSYEPDSYEIHPEPHRMVFTHQTSSVYPITNLLKDGLLWLLGWWEETMWCFINPDIFSPYFNFKHQTDLIQVWTRNLSLGKPLRHTTMWWKRVKKGPPLYVKGLIPQKFVIAKSYS